MPRCLHRREMLKATAGLTTGVWLGTNVPNRAEDSPNEKLNIACIGIGGRGRANLGGVKSQNIVSLCDVDRKRAGKAYEQHPQSKQYWDFRKMLDDMENQNTLFIGTEGMLLCGFGKRKLVPEDKFADYEPPAESIPDSPGFHKEWLLACKGGAPATCDFAYSGPLAETVLLGNVAYRAQGAFDWDAETLTVTGSDAAAELIRTPFREGWEVW